MLFVACMVVGDYPISPQQLFASLTGRGTRATDFIVYDLRLPRVVTGMAIGLCFGMSGAIFQSMIRNPLASPDIIGITSGASASAVVAILVFGLGGFAVSGISFVGAVITAALIYGLAWRKGLAGYRLVLVGIGIAAMLASVIDYLMTRAEVNDAQVALLWLTGSLNGASTDQDGAAAGADRDHRPADPVGRRRAVRAAAGRRHRQEHRHPGRAVPAAA